MSEHSERATPPNPPQSPVQIHLYTDEHGWTTIDPNVPLIQQPIATSWFSGDPNVQRNHTGYRAVCMQSAFPQNAAQQRTVLVSSGLPAHHDPNDGRLPTSTSQPMWFHPQTPFGSIPPPPPGFDSTSGPWSPGGFFFHMGQPPFAYVSQSPNPQAGQIPSANGVFIPPCILPHVPILVPWLFTQAPPTAPNADRDSTTGENPGGPPSNQQRGYNNQSNTTFWSPLALHGYSASLFPTNPLEQDGIFAATYVPSRDGPRGVGDTTDKPSLDHTGSWSRPQLWYANELPNDTSFEKTQSNAMPSKVRYRVRKAAEPKDGISVWRTERAYSPSSLCNTAKFSHLNCEHGSTLNKLPTNECVHVRITGTAHPTSRNSSPVVVLNDGHLPPPPKCRCCQCVGTIASRQLTNTEDYTVVVLGSSKLKAQPARFTAAEERVMDQVRCFCSTDLNATHSIEAVELPVNATRQDRAAMSVTVPNAESQVSSDSILTAFVNAASRKLDNELKQRRMNRLTSGMG